MGQKDYEVCLIFYFKNLITLITKKKKKKRDRL